MGGISSKNTLITAAGALVATVVLLSACGSNKVAKPTAGPHIGGTLVDLQNFSSGDPEHFDPAQESEASASQLDDLLYDGLTVTDEHGNARGAVASSFTSNDDATEWTFILRTDVRFSDDSPVLPSSFKHAWQRILDPTLEADNADRMGEFQLTPSSISLDNVVADDANHTLKIALSQADRDFPALVAIPAFSPMPANVPLDKSIDGTAMIGNGPYVLDAPIQSGQTVRISRNLKYYGGPDQKAPYLDHIEFRVSQSLEAAYNDFAAGNGQVALFPSTATADLQKYQKQDIVNSPTMGIECWGFDMSDPDVGGPQNLKLRQAIDKAIDKAAINQKAYGGAREIASQFSSPTTPGSDAKPVDGKPDVEGAKELLKEWGKKPPTLKVSFNSDAGHADKAAIIAANLNAVGIPAASDPVDLDPYRQGLSDGTIKFFRFAWVADYPSYRLMLQPSFATSKDDSSVNFQHYSNPAVDKLFADAQKQPSADQRNDIYRQAEKLIMADQPIVPLDWITANLIKAPEVHDLSSDPAGIINYSKVWLDPPAPSK